MYYFIILILYPQGQEKSKSGVPGSVSVEQTVTFSLLASNKESGGHDVFEVSLNKAVCVHLYFVS